MQTAHPQPWQPPLHRKQFTHRPLDHSKSSIRLLKVLPDRSPDGLIQCTMIHATTDAEYTCLSYTWGPELPTSVVLINSGEIHVRRNLFDFLEVAGTLESLPRIIEKRTQLAIEWKQRDIPNLYWIDALCINQQDHAERIHQVQQMGDVYSKAAVVVSWLGKCEDRLAPLIPILFEDIRNWRSQSLESNESSTILWQHETKLIAHDFEGHGAEIIDYVFGNPYWRRAWITQEVKLARHHTVILGPRQISLEVLLQISDALTSYEVPYDSRISLRRTDWDRPCGGTDSLLQLINTFKEKECSVPQDRVFSLLSLCDKRFRIDVDYECSKEDLLYRVLSTPKLSNLCFCCALVGAQTLRLADSMPWSSEAARSLPYIEMDLYTIGKVPGDHRFCCSFLMKGYWKQDMQGAGEKHLSWTVYYVSLSWMYTPITISCDGSKENMPVRISSNFFIMDEVICQHGEGIALLSRTPGGERTLLRISFWALGRICKSMVLNADRVSLCEGHPHEFSCSGVRIGYPERTT